MKFSTTTSSIICATMALSPSLTAAVPTGMETPTSPNPVGSHSIRQFPSSPIFDGEHSPLMNHPPAIRMGQGSPRRSIPSRLVKVHRRGSGDATIQADASDTNPVDGIAGAAMGLAEPVTSILRPVTGTLSSITRPVFDKLGSLPVVGGAARKVGAGLGLSGVHVNAVSLPTSLRSTGQLASESSDEAESEPETSEQPSDDTSSHAAPNILERSDGSPYKSPEPEFPYPKGLGSQAKIICEIPGALIIEFPSGEIDTVAYPYQTGKDEGGPGSTESEPSSPTPDAPPPSPTTSSPEAEDDQLHPTALLDVVSSSLLPSMAASSAPLTTPAPPSKASTASVAAVSLVPVSNPPDHSTALVAPSHSTPIHTPAENIKLTLSPQADTAAAALSSGQDVIPEDEELTETGPMDKPTFALAEELPHKPETSPRLPSIPVSRARAATSMSSLPPSATPSAPVPGNRTSST